jgi:hypothetical protein
LPKSKKQNRLVVMKSLKWIAWASEKHDENVFTSSAWQNSENSQKSPPISRHGRILTMEPS